MSDNVLSFRPKFDIIQARGEAIEKPVPLGARSLSKRCELIALIVAACLFCGLFASLLIKIPMLFSR